MFEQIEQIFSLLYSLKQNLPKYPHISERYVNEYHSLVSRLEKIINVDLKSFFVSLENEKHYKQGSWDTGEGGGWVYGPEKFCERAFLLTKLDALLNCFQIEKEEIEIGFKSCS